MKNLISGKTVLVALSLAVLLMAAPAGAQTPVMTFNIPFAFTAGERLLPAGMYRFTVDESFRNCRIDPLQAKQSVMVRLQPATTDRATSNTWNGIVRFEKYGEQYFLSGVWRAGYLAGHKTIVSRKLIESAKRGGSGDVVTLDYEMK